MGIKCPKCNTDNPDTQKFCGECATPLSSSKDIPVTETLETLTEELTTGSTFAGRYQIIEELGKGGMGKVYKALDTDLKEKVAIKLIKPEVAADEKTIERFRNELKFARKIRHKNVCQMYDLNKEEGTHYITMEYVHGEDLKRLIRKIGQMSAGQVISIAVQVCEGMAEAHRLGVVHRDLKPQNIMVDEEGNVRIMDFGIARSVTGKDITGAGVMIGTPEYMSPEQVEGKESDQRSDIYSFGVILYEMVTGRVPFEGDTPFTVGVKHKSERPKDPKELNAQIPENLNNIIMRCLEKDKEKRYQNVRKILSEIKDIEVEKHITMKIPEWKNSIAVLPFKNMSADPEQEYFCEGIAEEIINTLTHIKDLRVVARTSAFSFKGKDEDIREIGRKLSVDKVLEGSVRKEGNRLRIMAQLINAEDGYQLWSERYDRTMEDVFDIQDEISMAIVDNLKAKLLKSEKKALIKQSTDDLEAYNLYLRGRYFWNRRHEFGLQKAIECFKKAIERDPHYALPLTGLADSYNILGYYGYLPPDETFPEAKAAAEKALEINDTIAEAHASLGYVSTYYDWNWEFAENEFKQAINNNPNYPTTHHWYALFLVAMGRFDEAVKEAMRGYELDPLSLIINVAVGVSLYGARRYEEAIEQYTKVIEMDPNFSTGYFFAGMPYIAKNMWDEAIRTFQRFSDLSDESPLAEGFLGLSYGLGGQREKAIKILNRLKKLSKLRYVSPYYISLVYMGLGQNADTLKYMEEAFKKREPLLVYINIDPIFDNFRSIAQFKELLKKMNLK